MRTQSQSGAPTPGTNQEPERKRRPMTAAHKAKLREAAQRRKLNAGGGITGTTTNRQNADPLDTFIASAAGPWNIAQVDARIRSLRLILAGLEGLRGELSGRTGTQTQHTERTMSAGGGFQQAG